MSDIVNLRQARKAQKRTRAEQKAEENRARFGQTRAARDLEKKRKALDEKNLDGQHLEDEKK